MPGDPLAKLRDTRAITPGRRGCEQCVAQLDRLDVPHPELRVDDQHPPPRSPSLHVYREPDRGWYCFGCGRGGSIYDLAALLAGRETRGQDFSGLRRELEELML